MLFIKCRQIVKNEGESIQKDFKEDQKDLRQYKGDFLWGVSNQGTNLIFTFPVQLPANREYARGKKLLHLYSGTLEKSIQAKSVIPCQWVIYP